MCYLSRRSEGEHELFVAQVSDLMSRLGGPLCNELNSFVQRKDYRSVIDYVFNYQGDLDFSDCKYARQIQALLNKQADMDFGYKPEAKARKTFNEMEERCRLVNDRFDLRAPKGAVASVLHRTQQKISKILGDLPPLDSFDFSFGPGASTSVKMRDACFRSKLSAVLTCSEELLPGVGEFLSEFPNLTMHHATLFDDESMFVDVQVGPGRLQFVPKNCKTHRPIVVEPLLNGLAQRGIGSYLKTRLRNFGLDLSNQDINRRLAYEGSISDDLATIDLSSASDCISISVVYDLLPLPWANFLAGFRTGSVSDGTKVLTLEKFSSMGNGYTFELESIIFYSLALSVCDYLSLDCRRVRAFGDDIIMPSQGYHLMELILDYCGFLVNREKSFWTGPFRESCGTDWLNGMDIRPFYLKERISDRYLYVFHNWALRNCERELADLVHSWTHPAFRIYGPDGFGDGHLIGTHSLRLNRAQRRSGWGGGFFDTYSLRKRSFNRLLPGDWQVPAYSVYTRSGELKPTDPDVVRGSRGYQRISIYTLTTSIFGR